MNLVETKQYEDFVAQFCRWAEHGEPVPAGNQDINHSLALQRRRLERHRVGMTCSLKLRGDWQDEIHAKSLSDAKYTNELAWRGYQREVDYYLEGKKRLHHKDCETLYLVITRLKKGSAEGQERCCCPSCGGIATVEALLDGCPFCRARFLISDLFPKVTNFFFMKDLSMSETESKRRTTRWMLSAFLLGLVLGVPFLLESFAEGMGLIISLISWLAYGGVLSLIGYLALSLRLMFQVVGESARQAPTLFGQLGAMWRLPKFMKRYDPSFSFDYFAGKVQSLLKILIFSEHRGNLSVYEGPEVDCGFDSIVDAHSANKITLNRCRVEGDYCHLDVNVYLTDVYAEPGRIYKKTDRFRVTVCKNIARPIDYGFSIKKVSCKNCGASFDASTERHCPYCKTAYSLKEDDWVITHIEKKRRLLG